MTCRTSGERSAILATHFTLFITASKRTPFVVRLGDWWIEGGFAWHVLCHLSSMELIDAAENG
jgi:hypothetical protein